MRVPKCVLVLTGCLCAFTSFACAGLEQPNTVRTSLAGPVAETDVATALSVTPRDPNSFVWSEFGLQSLWAGYFTQQQGLFSTGWAFSQALDVVVDSVRASGGRAHLDMLRTLYARYQQIAYSASAPLSYSDHAFMGLALVRASVQMGAAASLAPQASSALSDARKEWQLVVAGENTTLGGMFTTSAKTAGNSATVGATSRLGCELYKAEGHAEDLATAQRLYAAWHTRLMVTDDGHVNDTIDTTGFITSAQYTHNYGTLIGAALCLHEVTGQAHYRDEAVLMGNYLLESMVLVTGGHTTLNESLYGSSQVPGDPALYKGITIRYLAELALHVPGWTALETALNGSAAGVIASASGDQFGSLWGQAPFSGDGLSAQISATMCLSSLAATATGRLQDRTQALSYEAEQQIFSSGILNESIYAGFSGTGYLAGWISDQTSATFAVNTPYRGTHRVAFRYSVLNQATRVLTTNFGSSLVTFPPTGSYTHYTTLSAQVMLNPGINSLQLALNTSVGGSAQYLNFDNLQLYPEVASTENILLPPLPPSMPTSPVDSVGACGTVPFSWETVAGASRYDLIVDDEIVWSGAGTQTSLTSSQLAPGAHTWYVVAFNSDVGTPGPAVSFVSAAEVAPPENITTVDTAGGLLVSWTPPSASTRSLASVRYNGELRCSRLPGSTCLIPNLTVSELTTASVNVGLVNPCAQAGRSVP